MFKVLQIDHVELFVPDRYEAARWYEHTLGLQVVPECEPWAAGGGPLMISSDGGSTKLALFEGQPAASAPDGGVSARGVSRESRRFCGVPPATAGSRAQGLAADGLSPLHRWSITNRRIRSTSTIPGGTCSKSRPTITTKRRRGWHRHDRHEAGRSGAQRTCRPSLQRAR